MGYFKIDERQANISDLEFKEFYFNKERPLLLRNFLATLACTKTFDNKAITHELLQTGLFKKKSYWLEGRTEDLQGMVPVPELVRSVLSISSQRERNCRIWLHERGNITPWHYDGNFIFVFNLQVQGRKRWSLVSPETPLPCYPFSRVARFDLSDAEAFKHRDHTQFVLEEGDLLFLPPFWSHRVVAEGEFNINLNWVGTKNTSRVTSELYWREVEILRCAEIIYKITGRTHLLNQILGAGVPEYLEKFAGIGWEFIHQVGRGIPTAKALTRLAKEARNLPMMLKNLKAIQAKLAAIK